MSSASKGLRRAGIGGLSALLAATAMTGLASTAQADWAAAGGQIGLVDASNPTAGTQGANLVFPGASEADLGSIRLAIPNTFKAGDTIDLAIFDRTADVAGSNNGQINADQAHKLGFTKAPTVTVDTTPYAGTVTVAPANAANDANPNNTEGDPAAWDKPAPAVKPSVAPKFTATLVSSSRGAGVGAKDIIRLTQVDNQAAGDTDAVWSVSVSDLQAALGTSVSPGELRIVPFAYNGTPTSDASNWSPLFNGNRADVDGDGNTFDPVIGTYTVPAWVSPVTWNIASPTTILADSTTQTVGNITIAETNNYSLDADTYTIDIAGANVENDASNPVTITKSGGATDESITNITYGANSISFDLVQTTPLAADQSKLSLTLSGLQLSANTPGAITYTLSGGSIDEFLSSPAGTAPASQSPAPDGVPADAAFSANVNQTDIEGPTLDIASSANSLPARIGGADRFETAAKVAQFNGPSEWAVIASGEDFPDALSSNYLASQFGTTVLLTKKGTLPRATIDALRQMGALRVFVVGGPNVISPSVVNTLQGLKQWLPGGTVTTGQGNLQVTRISGADRYATNRAVNEYAAAISEAANPVGRTIPATPGSSKLTALVASGEDFADALAAGPGTSGVNAGGALSGALPLILTKGTGLSAAASAQLTSLGIEHAVIVGGTAAVSDGVKGSIEAAGVTTARISGADRFATAAAVATWEATPIADGGLGFDDVPTFGDEHAYLASGTSFADALAAGPLAGGNASPILLTNATSLPAPTTDWLTGHAAEYQTITALGLGAAISSSVLNQANAAISAS